MNNLQIYKIFVVLLRSMGRSIYIVDNLILGGEDLIKIRIFMKKYKIFQ